MKKPDFNALVAVLKTIQDPALKKDLISLDHVKELKVGEDGNVTLKILLTAPTDSMKAKVKEDIENGLKAVPNVMSVNVTIDSTSLSAARANTPNPAAAANAPTRGIPGVKHIIAVSSGKGGVGKSTVSVNLAVSLALDGKRVGIMDADIYGPNIPTMMGVTENPKLYKDEEKGEMFIPPSSHNVKVMSMGFLVDGDQPVIWRGPMLHNILNQFCNRVNWGDLDYLILDLPPGTGDVQLSLAQMLPLTGTVLVTTPQEISLQDVRKAFTMWEKVKVPVLGVVENMSYFLGDDGKRYEIFGSGGGDLLAKKFNSKVYAHMPLLAQVREGGDEGKPIVIKNSATDSAKFFRELARKVAEDVMQLDAKSSATPSLEIGQF
jgi:ATP-binding protein involved in chromosome partitioning